MADLEVPRKRVVVQSALMEPSTSVESSASSAVPSPADTPAQSASSTSLSSLASVDADAGAGYGKLVDSQGNAFTIPEYTMKDIHNAIPAHCFKRSAVRGLSYVARDIASLALTFYLFHQLVTPERIPSLGLRVVLWTLYTFVQGLFGTGLWVMAHECGHQSFSPSKVLNDTVGWICHSVLLVPYFSWKISHGKHHKATAHLERDMVFVPKTREQFAASIGRSTFDLSELVEEAPIMTMFDLLQQQLGGWPCYLFTNVTGHNYHERQREGRGRGRRNGFLKGVNHFNPSSPLYEAKDEHLILLSDLGLAIVVAVLVFLGRTYGWSNLALWYGAPYLWVNHWLVAITYLQHTDPRLPHYDAKTWNFLRGAASTIDRDFGFIGRHLFHGIIETHVLHHHISTIPFYHADEATEAIKPVMGRHYQADVRDGPLGFLRSLYTSCRTCKWVEPLEGARGEGRGVFFYRNHNGIGLAPQKLVPEEKKGMMMASDTEGDE